MMKKCKITILKTTLQKDLAEEYGVPNLSTCPLCHEAWKAIYQYVFALAHGAETWYYGDWIDEKNKGVAICSCNDGLRPVIMKIERTEEDEQ